jgi:hypothetical protein
MPAKVRLGLATVRGTIFTEEEKDIENDNGDDDATLMVLLMRLCLLCLILNSSDVKLNLETKQGVLEAEHGRNDNRGVDIPPSDNVLNPTTNDNNNNNNYGDSSNTNDNTTTTTTTTITNPHELKQCPHCLRRQKVYIYIYTYIHGRLNNDTLWTLLRTRSQKFTFGYSIYI